MASASIEGHLQRVRSASTLYGSDDTRALSALAASIRELSFFESEEAVRCLMQRARQDRVADTGASYALHLGGLAARRLAAMASKLALPTLILELHHAPNPVVQGSFLEALGPAGGAEILPILERADALGQNKRAICSALEALEAPAGEGILLSALEVPHPEARVAAAQVLAQRAGEPAMGDARAARWANQTFGKAPRVQRLDLLTHPGVDVRRSAVAACCARPRASLVLALSLAWELDRALAARWRADTPETPFDWGDWRGLIPGGATGRGRARTAWAATQPKQKLTDGLRRILDEGAETVAETYPVDQLALAEAELTHWASLEAEAVG